jgi:hypothetical protein
MNGSHVAKAMTATGLRRTLALVGALLLYALAGGAQALTVTDIEFSSRPGSKFEVRLDFDDVPPAELQSYTIEKPARIAIDFPRHQECPGAQALLPSLRQRDRCPGARIR